MLVLRHLLQWRRIYADAPPTGPPPPTTAADRRPEGTGRTDGRPLHVDAPPAPTTDSTAAALGAPAERTGDRSTRTHHQHRPPTTAAALRALCALCALLLHRAATATASATATAMTATAAAARRLWHWLTTEQDLSNEEGEIHMTGARYICICSLVCVVLILLASIGD